MKKRKSSRVCAHPGNKKKNRNIIKSNSSPTSCISIPYLPISPGDLQAIESVIRGYLVYLRKSVPLSPKRTTQLRILQNLQVRLGAPSAPGQQREAIQILLTIDELTALKDALLGFNKLVDEIVPPSRQRDEVIQSLEGLRQAVSNMLAQHSDDTN